MTSYTKNFVVDYGAPTNGTSDSAVKWRDFITFLGTLNAGDDVTMLVPNAGAGGSNTYVFNSVGTLSLIPGILGGLTLTINASGVTFTDGGGLGFNFDSAVLPEDTSNVARINSVSIGSTTVRLKTLADKSKYTVLQWLLVTGVDLQHDGVPICPAFIDYVQITAIDAATGIITFTPALTNTYLDTWPLNSPGGPPGTGPIDQGGPATIYGMPLAWDINATINNLTVNQLTDVPPVTFAVGKSITFNNLTMTPPGYVVPTECKDIVFNNCNQNATIEVDKCVQNVTYSGGTEHRAEWQSMSVVNTNLLNVVFDADIIGTGRHATINGCTSNTLSVGTVGFGRTDSCNVSNSSIASISTFNISTSEINITDTCTMSNGVITLPVAAIMPVRWYAPGTWMFWSGSKYNLGAFQVLEITRDVTNSYVRTNLTGGFPIDPVTGLTVKSIRVHNCPVWNASNNIGSGIDLLDISQPGAQGRPIWEYSKRTYTGSLRTTAPIEIWGTVKTVKINVTKAYTGVSSLTAECLGAGGADALDAARTAIVSFNPQINLKQTGERVYTSAGATNLQSGDTAFPVPGAVWFVGAATMLAPFANRDIIGEDSSTWPSFTVEINSSQGLFTGLHNLKGDF